MTGQYATKLIKLSNGDDVVGEVDLQSLKTSEIKIKNPQRIVTLTNTTPVSYTHLTLPTICSV